MDEWQKWLVSFDTDRIKDYVFATNRLKEIRGASVLLRKLDKTRKSDLAAKGVVVYSAGGGAAVLVNSKADAKDLIARIAKEFRHNTITASITGVAIEPEPANDRPFGKRMDIAGKHLRQAKAAKAELVTLPVEPYLRLCSSCGQHPAVEPAQDGSDDWLCAACAQKRKLGGQERQGFFKKLSEWAGCEVGDMPIDLDAIGEVSTPPGYVGFIALDGNHIGELLSKPETIKDYRAFSKSLEQLARHQTFAALREYGQPRRGVAPFEIILMGGDDVLLITAADIAIEVAMSIIRGFEENSRQEVLEKAGLNGEQNKLTMAGGVVLAHADFPIPAMHSLAEALQKEAKKLCAQQKHDTGAIDFVVVSSSDTDLAEMRRAIPHRRPYTLADLNSLIDYIRKFKKDNFPTSQLQAMYQALFVSEVNAQLASIATLGRLGQRENSDQYNLLRDFFKEFGTLFDGQLPPWDEEARKKGTKVSALTDLVELYPFIQPDKGDENNENTG